MIEDVQARKRHSKKGGNLSLRFGRTDAVENQDPPRDANEANRIEARLSADRSRDKITKGSNCNASGLWCSIETVPA